MKQEILNELLSELKWKLPENVTLKEGNGGITIECDGKNTVLTYGSNPELARGLTLLKTYGTERAYTRTEKCAFKTFGTMIDCSRNAVPTVATVKQMMRRIALMGYNMIQLYTEDTYEVEGEPYFGYLRGRYTKAELKELNAYAAELGLELIPSIQVMAHLNAIFNWEKYGQINDCNDIILVGDERTYELIEHMFNTAKECFTTDRIVVGMDEAFMLGLGQYRVKHGLEEMFSVFSKHLTRICEIAQRLELKPVMYSDMFFHIATDAESAGGNKEEILAKLREAIPVNIELISWSYQEYEQKKYSKRLSINKSFERPVWFAGSARKWGSVTPENQDSINASRAAIPACIKEGIENVYITLWGDDGAEASLYSSFASLYYPASLAYGEAKMTEIKRVFRNLTGIRFDDFLMMDNLKLITKAISPHDNPQKCFFYNDPLLGMFDTVIEENYDEIMENLKRGLPTLKRLSKNPDFGHTFASQYRLTEVLLKKVSFGIKLRKAYKADDRAALAELVKEGKALITLIDKFYEAFRTQWYTENKPNGFDVQDIRIGGLLKRMEICNRVVTEYLDGKIASILELEEELLPLGNRYLFHWRHQCTPSVLG